MTIEWIRRAAVACGRDPARYFNHSGRIGGASAAHSVGFPIDWIMQQGFWKSLSSALRYCRGAAGDHAWCTDALAGILQKPAGPLVACATFVRAASAREAAAAASRTRADSDSD